MSHSSQYHLFASLRSPFARRIRLALKRLGIENKETLLDVFQYNPELLAANPMGMVPTLVFPDFGPVGDSATILEVLQEKTGDIWPKDLHQRVEALFFQETKMHEAPSPYWVYEHASSIQDTLDFLSKAPAFVWEEDGKLTQAAWDLGVAIEYTALRIPEIDWKKHPGLVSVVEKAKQDPFFVETTPKL